MNRTLRAALFATGNEQLLYNTGKQCDTIVMYHHVMRDGFTPTNLRQISQSDFRNQLLYMKKRYEIVSLNEIFESESTATRIAITFDDGLVNNLRNALPVLEELNLAATVFVCAIEAENQNVLWPDALELLLSYREQPVVFGADQFKKHLHGIFVNEKTGQSLTHSIKHLHLEEKWEFINKLAEEQFMTDDRPWQQVRYEEYVRVMNKNEIAQLAASSVIEIGSHCITHTNLANLNEHDTLHELTASKSFLESATGKKITSLAYPDGRYTRHTIDLAEKCGYTQQLAVDYLFDDDRHDNRLRPRFGFYNNRSWIEQLHQLNQTICNTNCHSGQKTLC